MDHTRDHGGNKYSIPTYNTHARPPYIDEISFYDSTNKNNVYLFDFLELYYGDVQKNPIEGVWGYWTLATIVPAGQLSYVIGNVGFPSSITFNEADSVGVRPVINLKL